MTEPWIGIGLVMATFAALLAIFSLIGPLLQPEVLRKGLHISMGLTTLAFPWLFDTPWPVVLVAGHGHRDQVTGVRQGMPEAVAGEGRLAMRPPALATGPIETNVSRPQPRVPRQRRLGEDAPGEEPLPVGVAPVPLPAPPLGLVEQREVPVRRVLPAGPPDLGGPVRGRCGHHWRLGGRRCRRARSPG